MIISRYSNIITTMSFEQSLCSHLIEVTRYAFGTLLSIRFDKRVCMLYGICMQCNYVYGIAKRLWLFDNGTLILGARYMTLFLGKQKFLGNRRSFFISLNVREFKIEILLSSVLIDPIVILIECLFTG